MFVRQPDGTGNLEKPFARKGKRNAKLVSTRSHPESVGGRRCMSTPHLADPHPFGWRSK